MRITRFGLLTYSFLDYSVQLLAQNQASGAVQSKRVADIAISIDAKKNWTNVGLQIVSSVTKLLNHKQKILLNFFLVKRDEKHATARKKRDFVTIWAV